MKGNKKIIRWILLLLWMIFIFYMSSKSGSESTEQSNLVINILSYLGINLNKRFQNIASFIVRKTAHLTEYCILFILAYRVAILYINTRKAKIITLFFVFIYAVTDEIHQLFVPGREGMFRDVLIDTCGAIVAIGIIKLYEKLLCRNS